MSKHPSGATNELVNNFGAKIASPLKKDFDTFGNGKELPFINKTVELLDEKWAYDGQQFLFAQCKKIHNSPKIQYDGISKYGKGSIELADLMIITNFFQDKQVKHRQAFLSQSKCVTRQNIGYAVWKVDKSQYEFLDKRPPFELDYKDASGKHDVSGANKSFLNYSLVSDIHRPFFYLTNDMKDFMKENKKSYNFVHGKNPVLSHRLMYSTLKKLVQGKYGSEFNEGDAEYELIDDVYEFAKLQHSSSPNAIMTDGGEGKKSSHLALVEINIDLDGSILGSIREFIEREEGEISQGTLEDIRGSFDGIDEGGLRVSYI